MAAIIIRNRKANESESGIENLSVPCTLSRAEFLAEAQRDGMIEDGWEMWGETTRNMKRHIFTTTLRKQGANGWMYVDIIVKYA